MALTTGVVSQHTARRFFRQSCQEKLPRTRPLHMDELMLEPGFLKGRFYGQVCFMKKKTAVKTKIFELHGFFLWNISPFYFPLAIWLLPRDNHYGNWPRSGEIDLMETKGMDIVLAFFFHLFFLTERGFITCIYVRDFKTLFESLGNAWTSEWGGDHGIRSIGSTLHWGPDAGHNCFQKTHGEK